MSQTELITNGQAEDQRMKEGREMLQWFGHARREAEGRMLKVVECVEVQGRTSVGRPRKRNVET